ncbi:glycogen synthase GlgA [Pseudorhizobium tarimense]|uniref:glycogen synthase GlgA n=1 Tax=Pseudorhizobium tarimense TaxID=1079109 RepID=UPI001FF4776F|nr:glycogen synthase GlgA [Pseudorhizobium tarimense]MCJ8520145.1 glycogen synthase GlgA [Pseudorhizobium tarimense]
MKVLSVASEMYPLVKTGGLADVTGSLPKALVRCGVETTTLVPGYPTVMKQLASPLPLLVFDDLLGVRATLLRVRMEGLNLLVLDAPTLYDRPGGPYLDDAGNDHPDNWKRFAVLSLAAAEIAGGALPGWQPDLVHTHDWQTALTSVYMREMGLSVPSVITIHNIAFQGQFSADLLPSLGLRADLYSMDCLEYFGDISLLKGGLQTADAITTVSPTYAREILTPRFGMGMDGILNERAAVLRGIVNGIDLEVWNPSIDPHLPANYDYSSLRQRTANRALLLKKFDLDLNDQGPVFSAVSRLTWQKGMDMLAETADEIIWNGGKLIVFGRGDHGIEQQLLEVASRYPGRMAVHIGYDEPTAHLIHGGSDAIIQPSRFEPCGLTQLYALRYGCVPVVSRTGGLSETIIDANDAAMSARVATGFQFHPVTTDGLRMALRRALQAYADPKQWARLQNQGMKARFSWDRSAQQYAAVYASLLKTSPGFKVSNESDVAV